MHNRLVFNNAKLHLFTHQVRGLFKGMLYPMVSAGALVNNFISKSTRYKKKYFILDFRLGRLNDFGLKSISIYARVPENFFDIFDGCHD